MQDQQGSIEAWISAMYFQSVQSTGQPAFSTVLRERPSGQDAVVVAAPVLVNGRFGSALVGVRFLEHAQSATCVDVVLTYEPGAVCLSVCDDGPGFSGRELDDWLREEHLGLAGMHERAALLGGAFEVTSQPGAGTQVSLQLHDAEVAA